MGQVPRQLVSQKHSGESQSFPDLLTSNDEHFKQNKILWAQLAEVSASQTHSFFRDWMASSRTFPQRSHKAAKVQIGLRTDLEASKGNSLKSGTKQTSSALYFSFSSSSTSWKWLFFSLKSLQTTVFPSPPPPHPVSASKAPLQVQPGPLHPVAHPGSIGNVPPLFGGPTGFDFSANDGRFWVAVVGRKQGTLFGREEKSVLIWPVATECLIVWVWHVFEKRCSTVLQFYLGIHQQPALPSANTCH